MNKPAEPSPEVKQETCPMCEFEGKPCPGGAHVFALYEDGIRTVEDYAKMKAATSRPSPEVAPKRKHRWKTMAAASENYCLNCGVLGFMPMAGEECPNGAYPEPAVAPRETQTVPDEFANGVEQTISYIADYFERMGNPARAKRVRELPIPREPYGLFKTHLGGR
jgi:hypothetical protein